MNVLSMLLAETAAAMKCALAAIDVGLEGAPERDKLWRSYDRCVNALLTTPPCNIADAIIELQYAVREGGRYRFADRRNVAVIEEVIAFLEASRRLKGRAPANCSVAEELVAHQASA